MLRIEIDNPDIEERIRMQARTLKASDDDVVIGALALQLGLPRVLASLPAFACAVPSMGS